MKVIKSTTSIAYDVVPENHGTKFTRDGREWTFEPLPIVKVPIGYGRSDEQARALADEICTVLSAADLPYFMERYGIRTQPK